MKKVLLTLPLFIFAAGVNAQFTEGNSPVIGDKLEMYVLDSSAPSYEGVTGDNVTWDYSAYGFSGNSANTRDVEIVAPSTTPYKDTFTVSAKAMVISGYATTYFTDNAAGRKYHGSVFLDPVNGDVLANFGGDEITSHTYPMDFGATASGAYSGYPGITIFNNLVTGVVDAKINRVVDGKGTLKLAGNTYNNVLRYKIKDTLDYLFIGSFGNIPANFYHTQYEYYDFTVSKLPIFIYSEANFSTGPNGQIFSSNDKLVLSYELPSTSGISQDVLNETSVYPNPANDVLNILLPSTVTQANMVMTDALGREIMRKELNQIYSSIDVSSLNSGTYFVRMESNENRVVKSIVIK